MEKYTIPEMMRVPLTQISLNAKKLAGNLKIEEFLLKAIEPPPVKNIRQVASNVVNSKFKFHNKFLYISEY